VFAAHWHNVFSVDERQMAKSKKKPSFLRELGRFDLYKRNQGRLTRQLSWVGAAMILFFGAWTLSQALLEYSRPVRVGVPLAIAVVGAWVLFRVVNFPRCADFLISVEAEMDKVSWASRKELHRATVVVVCTMFFLGFVLFVYDQIWVLVFKSLGILQL